MSLFSFGCKKFVRLVSESEDRDLSSKEQFFLEAHRDRCEQCSQTENSMQMSLNMLRSATIEAQVPRSFDNRLIRRVKVQSVRESFSYWTPALIGSIIAFAIVFASLDLLAMHSSKPGIKVPAGTAFRDPSAFPNFELNQIPRFDR